ncbi:MAG: Tol-Pal system protein TolB, partial [Marinovum sp.]|nr:Tol-Pal system protein TolB [Marinovum sp.]
MMMRILILLTSFLLATAAVSAPLRIKITEGVVEPLPFAAPSFIADNAAGAEYAKALADIIAQDLTGSGLFRQIPEAAHISKITSFASPVQYSDWKAINAQALITGTVSGSATGQITVKFRIYDVFAGAELGKGLRFTGSADGWRRMAHKVADVVYGRITGESGYFDSRVVFVSETGRKGARKKRLAIMDYDGANVQYLTDSASIVLAPRFSPTGDRVLYTSYETGFPHIYLLDVGSVKRKVLQNSAGTMSFAPRFAPNGKSVVYSLEQGGNTDIFLMNLSSGKSR